MAPPSGSYVGVGAPASRPDLTSPIGRHSTVGLSPHPVNVGHKAPLTGTCRFE